MHINDIIICKNYQMTVMIFVLLRLDVCVVLVRVSALRQVHIMVGGPTKLSDITK